jgi:hypothetical protein
MLWNIRTGLDRRDGLFRFGGSSSAWPRAAAGVGDGADGDGDEDGEEDGDGDGDGEANCR